MENGKQHRSHPSIRFLVFSASLRKDSFNKILANLAANVLKTKGGVVDLADMDDFDCPSYNGDVEITEGIPSGAIEFRKRLLAADAFVISSPEYNASLPGNLKNLIDWASRFRPQPFNERHALLMSASPSMAGGNRGLWSLRIPLEHLGSRVFPDMLSLATAHQGFNAEGKISNETLAKRFEDNLIAFMSLVEAAKHYPCLKKGWIEFLGEKPDPVTERVE